MIRAFALLSVVFGITAVLGVAVNQKRREIGILKGMGASTSVILGAFTMQGLIIGFFGGLLGATSGLALVSRLASLPVAPGATPFPAVIDPMFAVQGFLVTLIVTTLAGIPPARQAAKLNPIEAIRYG